MEVLDRLADAAVQARPPRRRELGFERRAQQRVGEGVAPRSAGQLDDERGAHGRVEDVQQLVFAGVDDALEQVEVEVATDQRGDAEHPPGGLGQAGDAPADDVAHAPRDVEVARAAEAVL
jgi:hypothetical protein